MDRSSAMYAVIDFETNGMRADSVFPLEIGIVLLDENFDVVESIGTLIGGALHVGATHVHGITQRMVRHPGVPHVRQVVPAIADVLRDKRLIAHNAPYDSRVWASTLAHLGIEAVHPKWIDTLPISRRYYRHLPSHKLTSLTAHFAVGHDAAHTAESDALATAALLKRFVTENPELSEILAGYEGFGYEGQVITRDLWFPRQQLTGAPRLPIPTATTVAPGMTATIVPTVPKVSLDDLREPGATIVFSGFDPEHNRHVRTRHNELAWQRYLAANNYTVTRNLTLRDTRLLVVADRHSTSSKVQAANRWSIPVIDEAGLIALVGEPRS